MHTSPQREGRSLKQRIQVNLEEARHFFREELWDMDLRPLPRLKTAVISFFRILIIIFRGFIGDRCYMQAGTLTYLTLMALVPILALMFSVAKGLGVQEHLMQNLGLQAIETVATTTGEATAGESFKPTVEIIADSRLAEMPEQFGDIAITIFSVVEHTNVGTLGVIGLVLLIWTVIRVMGKIEDSFNSIWGVQTSRSLTRRVSGYISILVVVPILILCATSINAFLASERAIDYMQNYFGGFSMAYEFAIRGTVFFVIILAFVFLLMFMPNTRVRFFPALIGGMLTALAWFALQALYFRAQSGVTMYNAIYGTFAALPFFLVWLHTSWLIVLFGAEITFAVQTHRTYRHEQQPDHTSPASRIMLGFLIMYDIARHFIRGKEPWSVDAFIEQNPIPARLVGHVVDTLRERGLISAMAEQPDAYLPGRDPTTIRLSDIESAFHGHAIPQIRTLLQDSAPALDAWFREFRHKTEAGLSEQTLRGLVEKKVSRPPSEVTPVADQAPAHG